jgi:fumarate hydratase class I
MPVTVAVDSQGHSVHETGPREWKIRLDFLRGGKQ